MAKSKVACALSVAALVAGSGVFVPATFADPYVLLESCGEIENCAEVADADALGNAVDAGKTTILVTGDFALEDDLYPTSDIDLYLNNYTINTGVYSFISSNNLTIYADEDGTIKEAVGTWAPFYIYGNMTLRSGTIDTTTTSVYVAGDDATFTMTGGAIKGGSDSAVTVVVADGAKFTMQDGLIEADTWGVSVFKNAEFVMNGGTINVDAENNDGIGVSGNGSASGNNEGTNAKLTLNRGTINSDDLGVYAPQINGRTVLGEGLTINADKCGVEVRAGELSVEGATINVDPEATYIFNSNGNGSTASGVGISVSQHTTKQAISATISDGVITAPVALGEANPQSNSEEDIAKVELEVTGGEFNATNGQPVVASEDVTGFVSGGIFNKAPLNEDLEGEPGKYIANGYDIFASEGRFVVDESPVAYQSDGLFLQRGGSETLDLGTVGNKYATLTISGSENATVNGREVMATADGKSDIVISYNTQIHPMSTTVPLTVYSVGTDDNDVIEGEDRGEVADFMAAQIKNLLDSGEDCNNSLQLFPQFDEDNNPIDGSGIALLKNALQNGDELFTSLDALDLAEEYWAGAEGMNQVEEHMDEGEEIAMVYNVNLGLYAGDYSNQLGELTDLNDLAIEFDLEIPEEYREVPEGYVRSFSVLRFHRGVWDRPDFTNEGDVLRTSSSIFSTYVVAYTDVAESVVEEESMEEAIVEGDATEEAAETPETGTVTVAGVSAISAALVTSVVIGVLTAITSFAYVVRRRD